MLVSANLKWNLKFNPYPQDLHGLAKKYNILHLVKNVLKARVL